MKEINAFKCDFCGKVYQRKHAIAKHEISCSKNPSNNRACFGCNYLEKKDTLVWFSHPNGDWTEKMSLLYCSKKKHFVFPASVEHKKNALEPEGGDNEPMPVFCELRRERYNLTKDLI